MQAQYIRTLATSEESLRKQNEMVKQFVDENLLKSNVSKREIILFSIPSLAAKLQECKCKCKLCCQQEMLGSALAIGGIE